MTRSFAILLLLFTAVRCYGQGNDHADPYSGRPYRPGDVRSLHLQVPVGNITINVALKYTLLDDADGLFYSYGGRYKAEINKAVLIPGPGSKSKIPQAIINGFSDKTIELTDSEIRKSTISTTSMYYWFTVQDLNLDGKPDFAFIGDLGYHSAPVNYYVWVNINDNLVYWHNLSDVVSYVEDSAQRKITIHSMQNDGIVIKSYQVAQDTFLIPLATKH